MACRSSRGCRVGRKRTWNKEKEAEPNGFGRSSKCLLGVEVDLNVPALPNSCRLLQCQSLVGDAHSPLAAGVTKRWKPRQEQNEGRQMSDASCGGKFSRFSSQSVPFGGGRYLSYLYFVDNTDWARPGSEGRGHQLQGLERDFIPLYWIAEVGRYELVRTKYW